MGGKRSTLSANAAQVLHLMAEGRSYEQILALCPDLTYLDIFSAAREALDLAQSTGEAYEDRLATIRRTHPRAFEPWSHDEDSRLTSMIAAGEGVKGIARCLGRRPSAISSRVRKLSLETRDKSDAHSSY